MTFLNFFFYIFFWEWSSPGRVETELITNFFLRFFGLSRSSLARNEARMTFLNFFTNCFDFFFFGMLHLGLGRNVTQNEFIFLFFSGLPGPIWLEIKLERRFPFSFLDFFTIFLEWFWECFSPSQAETIPETILFFFFRALFGLKWSQNDFINFFTSCVEFFWECSGPY